VKWRKQYLDTTSRLMITIFVFYNSPSRHYYFNHVSRLLCILIYIHLPNYIRNLDSDIPQFSCNSDYGNDGCNVKFRNVVYVFITRCAENSD